MFLVEYLVGTSIRYTHIEAADADAAADKFRWSAPEDVEIVSVRREYS